MRKIKLFDVTSEGYNDDLDVDYKLTTSEISEWIEVSEEHYQLLLNQNIRNRFSKKKYNARVIMVEALTHFKGADLIQALEPILEKVKAEDAERERKAKIASDKRKKDEEKKKAEKLSKKIAAAEKVLREAGKL